MESINVWDSKKMAWIDMDQVAKMSKAGWENYAPTNRATRRAAAKQNRYRKRG